MKRLTTAVAAAMFTFVAFTSTGTASTAHRLTVKDARVVVDALARDTLGALLTRDVGSAPVYVSHCRVHEARGTCRVKVIGLSRCEYVAHVHRIAAGDVSWGSRLRCR